MKISEMISLLVHFKKEFGDIDVVKRGTFIGSDNIDAGFVYNNQLVLIDLTNEHYLAKFVGESDDEQT